MFIVTPSTVWNPAALETRSLPKRIFGRVSLIPRRGATAGLWARLIFESQVLRFFAALAPFVVAMLIWPELALPIAQAPLFMLMVVGFVELKVLRISKEKRPAILPEDEAARILDLFRFRALATLRKIAAAQGLSTGEITLVVEQSELANVAPLTLVSLQREDPEPEVLDPGTEERRIIAETLFAEGLTERALHRANLRADEFLRMVSFDARGVSAHARLAAALRKPRAPAAEAGAA
jgi:hypothetical protein